MRRAWLSAILLGSLWLPSSASATTYKIDKDHSTVEFTIRHLLSNTKGTFNDFEGTFDYVPGQPEQWKAEATIQAASIDTRVEPRDKHLRTADFFDVEKYPVITFQSTEVAESAESGTKLHGRLTMHGIEKPVVMDLQIHGEAKDPWGNQRAGFTATTTVNRKDFGLNWNKALETGQLLVGEEVRITIEVEGIAQ